MAQCRTCNGTGVVRSGGSGPFTMREVDCPSCHGTESVKVPVEGRPCPRCGGTGKQLVERSLLFEDKFVPCRYCNGTGQSYGSY